VHQHAWIFRVGVAGRNRHAEILSCFTSFSFLLVVFWEDSGNGRDVTDLRSSVIAAPRSRDSLQSARSYANICVLIVCSANSVSEARARNSRAAEAQPTAAAKEQLLAKAQS
jgi:hypothetical protein